MIKKRLTTIIILGISALTLAGCQNQNSTQSYSTIMAKGNKAVQQKNYQAAKAYFKSASLEKNNTKTSAYQKQAQHLADAQNYIAKFYFANAKDSLTAVTHIDNGSDKMIKVAKQQLKTLKTVKKNRHLYHEQIEQAEQNNDKGNTQQAHAQVTKLLKTTKFHQNYYRDLYDQAVEILLTSSQSSNNQKTSNNPSQTDNDTNKNATNNQNNSAPGETDTIQNPTANGKKITAEDIQKARQQLQEQGVQEKAASDSDIIRGIQKAASQGRTKVTPEDVGA
ncbi:outer membrane protein assembly factor BamD [Bombilactobacillus thymidiniphilus]|uniref:Lipoprotein n=1 Tax=Bombilactobacillus thymidiniphilus TaxID=2923363 RepID=A0ABY4PCA5_9LACO|nr:hypothetical protein [Bombilactobacillus thymidiniphilus]UQS83136.1 hypothetical protein MOO47_04945 [Bombilactobacillus thymidiniphilus]